MITQAQRIERKNYIGSSDAASIVGCNPYRNISDVYYEKASLVADSQATGDAIDVGNFCEDAVLNWFEHEKGVKLSRNISLIHKNGVMSANLDGLLNERLEIVEAKTAGIINPFDRDAWGEVGTDELPERIIIQVQHQMAVAGPEYRLAWVPVLLGGVGFRCYEVQRNDELIEELTREELSFWNNHVLPKIPPPEITPSLDTLKKLKREPFKSVSISDDLLLAWQQAKALEKMASVATEDAQKALLMSLGDAEEGVSESGGVTYMEQTRKAYLVNESKFRVLRWKGKKK